MGRLSDGEWPSPGRDREETECLLVPGLGRVKDWRGGVGRGTAGKPRVRRVTGVSKRADSLTGQPLAVMSKSSQLNPLIAKGF